MKFLIAVFLSRELQHEESNRAWWTGRWHGRGLGSYAMSQPAREFIVKIVEMSLWSSDFILGHLLLFILTPPLLMPFVDRLHSTMLCKSFFLLRKFSLIPLQYGSVHQSKSDHHSSQPRSRGSVVGW